MRFARYPMRKLRAVHLKESVFNKGHPALSFRNLVSYAAQSLFRVAQSLV
jgi:hypothetical protein